jgi:hypothetical protein
LTVTCHICHCHMKIRSLLLFHGAVKMLTCHVITAMPHVTLPLPPRRRHTPPLAAGHDKAAATPAAAIMLLRCHMLHATCYVTPPHFAINAIKVTLLHAASPLR